ncbi:MAG: HEAT repeat domain-containing protein [Kiritimatiellia bacterium]|jgi:HEAT repeat protein
MKHSYFLVFCLFCCSGLFAQAEETSTVTEQIGRNAALLKSHDMNTRRRAIDEMFSMSSKVSEMARDPSVAVGLSDYAQKWDENSYKAVLLLGRMGAEQSRPMLKSILAESRGIVGPMDDRYVLAPRMQMACLKALLRLKDDEAEKEVLSLLGSNEAESRVKGIECISYADDKKLIPHLVPLLDDKRDAVNVAPSGANYFIRVCDLAVNAIASISQTKTSFIVQNGARYSDDQLGEVRRNALQIR